MPRSTLAVALTVACLSSTALLAQVTIHADEIQPGARVRITAPGIVAGHFVGTVLSRSGDTVSVGGPNSLPLALPSSRITSLEISRGKSRADGAIRGMKWGAPIGLVLGLLTIGFSDACYDCANRTDDVGSRIAWVGVNGASGALWGAGIGALVGRERWESFDMQHRTALGVGQGAVRIALRYEF